MDKLLPKENIFEGFEYPREFLRIVDFNLVNLHPWKIIFDEQQRAMYEGLAKRYPGRKLMPFAHRVDCDDVACWSDDGMIHIVHDYASPGWEEVGVYASFYDWFKDAVQDMIEFDDGE